MIIPSPTEYYPYSMERRMGIPTIHCTINDCHYWDQGNMCNANEILVAQDAWAAQAPDNVDATSADTLPQMEAHTCMETCCKSYVHKKSNQIHADGVIRQQK